MKTFSFLACLMTTLLMMGGEVQALDMTEAVQGSIQAIGSNSMRILRSDNSKQFWATIDTNTVYDNVQKLSDFRIGDKVRIDYQINHQKNIAVTVTKMEVEGG